MQPINRIEATYVLPTTAWSANSAGPVSARYVRLARVGPSPTGELSVNVNRNSLHAGGFRTRCHSGHEQHHGLHTRERYGRPALQRNGPERVWIQGLRLEQPAVRMRAPRRADPRATPNGQFALTGSDAAAYVELDLGADRPIDRVNVVNRQDAGQDRIVGTVLSLRHNAGHVLRR